MIEINEKISDLKMIIEGNFVQLRWIEMQWVTPLIDTRVRADISHEIDSIGVHIEADTNVCVFVYKVYWTQVEGKSSIIIYSLTFHVPVEVNIETAKVSCELTENHSSPI